jgi:hypothetical protein
MACCARMAKHERLAPSLRLACGHDGTQEFGLAHDEQIGQGVTVLPSQNIATALKMMPF